MSDRESFRYHVPRSFLQPGENTLVIFEEIGGDPGHVSLAIRQVGRSVCGHVSEMHPPPVDIWHSESPQVAQSSSSLSASSAAPGAVLRLECPHPDQVMGSIKFASFGTPLGNCGSYKHGHCHSKTAVIVVRRVCSISPSFFF